MGKRNDYFSGLVYFIFLFWVLTKKGTREMIHIRDEGEFLKTGFNFYPFSSNQVGFKFYIDGKKSWQLRYSKLAGLLWVGKKSFKLKKAQEK